MKTEPVIKLGEQLVGSCLKIGKARKVWLVRRFIIAKILPADLGYAVAIIYIPSTRLRFSGFPEKITSFHVQNHEAEKMLVDRDDNHCLTVRLATGKVLEFSIPAKSPQISFSA